MASSSKKRKEFGRLISNAIDDYELDKKLVAEDLGIGLTTVYRIIHGETRIDKPIVSALVRAINNRVGRNVLEEPVAMKAAGISSNGHGQHSEIADLIAAHASRLPESVQEDVLVIVRALEKKHALQKRAAVGK